MNRLKHNPTIHEIVNLADAPNFPPNTREDVLTGIKKAGIPIKDGRIPRTHVAQAVNATRSARRTRRCLSKCPNPNCDHGYIDHPQSEYDRRMGESRRLHTPCPDCQARKAGARAVGKYADALRQLD